MESAFRKDVAIQAMLYVIGKNGGTCDYILMNKVMYFADQLHLSRYGRSITGDRYIAMRRGAVPSNIYDIMKAADTEQYNRYFSSVSSHSIKANIGADTDWLSKSDMICLDIAYDRCKDKTFAELSNITHGYAWEHSDINDVMSTYDILTEIGDTPGYIAYVEGNNRLFA